MDLLEQMFRLYNRPAKNVVNLLWDMQITKLSAAQGATTLLVGDLGNFTISYHGDHALNSLLREGRILELLQQLTYQQRGLSNRARLHIIYNMLTPPRCPSSFKAFSNWQYKDSKGIFLWSKGSIPTFS